MVLAGNPICIVRIGIRSTSRRLAEEEQTSGQAETKDGEQTDDRQERENPLECGVVCVDGFVHDRSLLSRVTAWTMQAQSTQKNVMSLNIGGGDGWRWPGGVRLHPAVVSF